MAIAATQARQKLGLKKILIVDWDLHHGNGTQHSFYDDPGIMYFSTHQSPMYPGTGSIDETGRGAGEGYTINVPLPRGQGDAEYIRIFEEILAPLARLYRPELILVSAGFDICRGDSLGGMAVTVRGFVNLARMLMNIADECCEGRLAATLAGGYNIAVMTGAAKAILKEMSGETRADDEMIANIGEGADRAVDGIIHTVIRRLRSYWPLPNPR